MVKRKRKTISEGLFMAKQNTIRKTIHRNVERELVREYLLRETERAGYGGLKFNRTPEGTEVTIQAEMVGRVYGRRGKTIRELNDRLRSDFDLYQPQLQVEEIEERSSGVIRASNNAKFEQLLTRQS